jgi:hypothetical protein
MEVRDVYNITFTMGILYVIASRCKLSAGEERGLVSGASKAMVRMDN